jgi:hypothetical protein
MSTPQIYTRSLTNAGNGVTSPEIALGGVKQWELWLQAWGTWDGGGVGLRGRPTAGEPDVLARSLEGTDATLTANGLKRVRFAGDSIEAYTFGGGGSMSVNAVIGYSVNSGVSQHPYCWQLFDGQTANAASAAVDVGHIMTQKWIFVVSGVSDTCNCYVQGAVYGASFAPVMSIENNSVTLSSVVGVRPFLFRGNQLRARVLSVGASTNINAWVMAV